MVLLSTTATPQHENPLSVDVHQDVVLGIEPISIHEPQVIFNQNHDESWAPEFGKEVAWYEVEYLEMEETADLGFDTAQYLPDDFDPFATPTDVAGINFMEEEEAGLDPDFDTSSYLPEGFDPYGVYIDLDDIVYIEEEDLELGFDTAKYLPVGFDPYCGSAVLN